MSVEIKGRVKTAGELRQFLADLLVGLKNGHVDHDTARGVIGLAAQVNESFYAEIKIARIQKDLGRDPTPLGALPIDRGE